MPIYQITAPDGKILEIEGPYKPSKEIIAKLYDEYLFNKELERDAVPAAQEKKGIEKILNIASKIAPYAGIALKTNPAGMLASASLTGGSRFVEGKTEGESNLQALKNAAIAAGIDLSTLGLGKVTGKIIKTKPVSSVLSQVGEFISSVPRKSIKKAIQDPSIFKKTEDFEDVGQSAKDALSRQMTKVGQRAKKEKNILKRSDADIDLSTYAKREESLLDRKIGKQPKYNNKEKKIIKSVLKNLKNETSPDGINDIISRIDETIKWDAINKPSSRVEKVLKKIRKKASNTLKKNIKGYEESRKKQQEFLKEANKILGSRLADTKDASKLFKRQQEEPIRKALEKLDELEPQSKLLDRAENLRIQKQFSNIFPGQGGGSGSAEGIANISRALLPLAGGSMIGGVPGAVLGTASTLSSSPRMLKNIIRRSPASISALGKFLASSNISTPTQRNQDGSLTQERLNKLRGERN